MISKTSETHPNISDYPDFHVHKEYQLLVEINKIIYKQSNHNLSSNVNMLFCHHRS